MASTADLGMSAGSNLAGGPLTNSRTFTLPASPLYRVESVVAHVDNTAGGDTTATLTYADTNGEVIAKKPQAGTIPAGNTGTATFALRLDDNAATAAGGIRFSKTPQTGGYLVVTTTGDVPATTDGMQFDSGTQGISMVAGGNVNLEAGNLLDLTSDTNDVRVFAADQFIVAADNQVNMRAIASAMTLRSALNLNLNADSGNVHVTATGAGFGLIVDVDQITATVAADESHAVTGLFAVDAAAILLDGPTTLESGDVEVKLPIGKTLTVFDHLNNPIFRVSENGDLQGKTGKALVFNL